MYVGGVQSLIEAKSQRYYFYTTTKKYNNILYFYKSCIFNSILFFEYYCRLIIKIVCWRQIYFCWLKFTSVLGVIVFFFVTKITELTFLI